MNKRLKRNSKPTEAELPAAASTGWIAKALALCSSGQITEGGPSSIRVRNWEHGIDDEEYIVLDLSAFWLPKSSLYAAKRLSDSEELSVATILAVDEYLGSVARSKSTHIIANNAIRILARVWEWGYLHDLYRPQDWTAAHFRLLWRELRTGGWPLALQLEERTRRALQNSKNIAAFIEPSHRKEGLPSIKGTTVQGWLHTNLYGRSLSRARKLLLDANGIVGHAVEEAKYSRTLLRTILGELQRISRLEAPYGFTVDPTRVLGSSARTDGIPPRRTPNLDIGTAVTLLDNSLKWIYSYSEDIIKLVRESLRIAKESDGLTHYERRKKYRAILSELPLKKVAEKTLGFKVSLMQGRKSGVVMLHHVVGMLTTAAFIVVAVMNARRRDEIRHPKLGLKRGSILEVDESMGLYEASFYIEKSFKAYVPFYVNKATFDAFQVLVRLNEAYVDAEKALGLTETDSASSSIFWQRPFRMVDGLSRERIWFEFDQQPNGAAARFIKHALGATTGTKSVGAHMFRRFYALIFFYRFEHATLQAVAYQLGHLNLGVTRQYVSDAAILPDSERIPIALFKSPEETRRAFSDDRASLERVIEEVGREKLEGVVESLLDGEALSGGFQRLVQRLHSKLSLRVDYSELDKAIQARRVAMMLSQKGHSVMPFPHGECMAGGVGKRRSARCYSEEKNRLDRAAASAATCAQCTYHVVSVGYLRAQKVDLALLRAEIQQRNPEAMHTENLIRQERELATAIKLHSVRLGVEE